MLLVAFRHLAVTAVCFLAPTALAAGPWEALPKTPPIPQDNPQTPAKIELGKQLFFEPRVSGDGTLSCNSCHNVMAGGDDSRATSSGIRGQRGGRSAPTVWNAAYLTSMFWDGRAATLEEQAKGPLINSVEMGMKDHDVVIDRLKQIPGYVEQFENVFGKNGVTIDNFAKAVASYERTLVTPDSPYDRFVRGDKTALSAQQQRGMKTIEETGCLACHSGPAFAGPPLPQGTGFFQKFPLLTDNPYVAKYKLAEDQGRFVETKNEADKNMWRVPTWRNVALTAPYFHNGSVATLDEAVRVMAKTQLSRDLTDAQVKDIVAFLGALTGPFPEQSMPRLPATPNGSVIPVDAAASSH